MGCCRSIESPADITPSVVKSFQRSFQSDDPLRDEIQQILPINLTSEGLIEFDQFLRLMVILTKYTKKKFDHENI